LSKSFRICSSVLSITIFSFLVNANQIELFIENVNI